MTRQSVIRKFAYIAREWFHTYIWKVQKRARTPYGFDLISGSYTANREMLTGKFEEQEVAISKSLLHAASVFVDIGANIGFYTCFALTLGKKTISVEPKRANLDLLYRNLSINGWINGECEVCPYALSDKVGMMQIYGATGTAASLLKGWAGHSDRFTELVPVTTLDNILSHIPFAVNLFVKIDVEGAELSVLKGAINTLKRFTNATWLIEICLSEYHPTGINPNYVATFDLMFNNGYNAFTADKRHIAVTKNDVTSWVKNNSCSFNVINFLFARGNN